MNFAKNVYVKLHLVKINKFFMANPVQITGQSAKIFVTLAVCSGWQDVTV